MRSRSAVALLRLPVRLHGIRLGQPTDLLLDEPAQRALGFVVLCGDDTERFLAYAAASLAEEEIGVESALMLLDDVDFYRSRAESLRALLGTIVEGGAVGDVLLAPDGSIAGIVADPAA